MTTAWMDKTSDCKSKITIWINRARSNGKSGVIDVDRDRDQRDFEIIEIILRFSR